MKLEGMFAFIGKQNKLKDLGYKLLITVSCSTLDGKPVQRTAPPKLQGMKAGPERDNLQKQPRRASESRDPTCKASLFLPSTQKNK